MKALKNIVLLSIALALFVPFSAFAQSASPAVDLSGSTSLNWSGYVAQSGTYTGVSATWTVPSVSSAQADSADAAWIGIGGVASQDLIQAGTEAVTDERGATKYQAWYELLPRASDPISLAVSPGDRISVSISESDPANNGWTITFDDLTTGQSAQKSVTYDSSLSSAEWIQELPAGVGAHISLDQFGSIDFSNAAAVRNGASVSLSSTNPSAVTLTNASKEALAAPSAIAGDGESFAVTRTAATSSAIALNRFGSLSVFDSSSDSDSSSGQTDLPQGYIPRMRRGYGSMGMRPHVQISDLGNGYFQISFSSYRF